MVTEDLAQEKVPRRKNPASRDDALSPANLTWQQEVGGSAIEASKIAGHATVSNTGDYTVVQLKRQKELARAIQDRVARAPER